MVSLVAMNSASRSHQPGSGRNRGRGGVPGPAQRGRRRSRRLLVSSGVLAGTGVILCPAEWFDWAGGLLFALSAAACWAAFIIVAKRTVSRMEPLQATTLMLVGAAIILTPIWLGTGVKIRGYGHALLLGLAVAVLSSALPYLLELAAIRRVRASTYSVLLSIEPAIAALMGFLILSQKLAWRDIGAILAVVAAAAGASWTAAAGGTSGGARRRRAPRRGRKPEEAAPRGAAP